MKVLSMVLLFLSFVCVSYADELTLLSGKTLEGKIVEQTDKYVKFDEGVGVVLTYYDEEIDSINGEPVIHHKKRVPKPIEETESQPSDSQATPTPVADTAPVAVVTTPAQNVDPSATAPVVTAPVPDASATPISNPQFASTPAFPRQINAHSTRVFNASLFSKVMGAFFLFIVFLYVLHSIPTFMIAKSLNTESPWLAWVPLACIYLSCKMAGRPGWWFLLSLVPLVGIVIFVILWMDIADKCHKPKWLGILVILPFVSLIFMWYLALSKQTPTLKI